MIVKCINSNGYGFTVGKLYVANPLTPQQNRLVNGGTPRNSIEDRSIIYKWIVINDDGWEQYVEDGMFTPLSEIRNGKLGELGI